jgi:hypothetical protein
MLKRLLNWHLSRVKAQIEFGEQLGEWLFSVKQKPVEQKPAPVKPKADGWSKYDEQGRLIEIDPRLS